MGNIVVAGPNEAIMVSGGWCGSTQKRTVVGGWAWAWWCVTDVQTISLEVMTLKPVCREVETKHGVALTVSGVAQVKVIKAKELLNIACEQFLGKSYEEVMMAILQTLEGHQRAILGTLTVEEIYRDRDQFAHLVREVAAPDLQKMGIEILSFVIRDINDNVQYLSSLGITQTAAVKRDAEIGVAQANRDAGIQEAEYEKASMGVKYSTDAKVEDNTRLFKLTKADYDRETFTAKAIADLAYGLQAAKLKQNIRYEDMQADVVERKKLIEVEEKEIERKEKELLVNIKLPAEAEAYRIEANAKGQMALALAIARAEAERTKMVGLAQASAAKAIGNAEAEGMRLKAAAYKQYGQAAMLSMALDTMPLIAAEVAAPLSKTDSIVLLGGATTGSMFVSDISKTIAQLPPALQALTGVDLSKCFRGRRQRFSRIADLLIDQVRASLQGAA